MDVADMFGGMTLDDNTDDFDDEFEDAHEASALKTLHQKFDGDFHTRHTKLAEEFNSAHSDALDRLREIVTAQQLNSAMKGSGKNVDPFTLPPEILADENVYITRYVTPAQTDLQKVEALLKEVQTTVADMQKHFDEYMAMCDQVKNCQPKATADLKGVLDDAKSHVVEYQNLATAYRDTANELEQLEAHIHALVNEQQGHPPKTPVVIGNGTSNDTSNGTSNGNSSELSLSETAAIDNALAAVAAAKTTHAEAHAHIKDIHVGHTMLTDLHEKKLPAAFDALVAFESVTNNHPDNADVQAKFNKATTEYNTMNVDVKALWLTYYRTVRIYIEQFAVKAETAAAIATNAAAQALAAVSTVDALNDTADVQVLITNLHTFKSTVEEQLDDAKTGYADATNNNDFLKQFANVDEDILAKADAAVAKSHAALQAATQAQADVNGALSQAQARLDVLNMPPPPPDHALADTQAAADNANIAAQQAADAAQQAADQLLIAQTALSNAQALHGDDAIPQITAEKAKAHAAAASAKTAADNAQTAAGQAASYAAMAQKAAESAADPATIDAVNKLVDDANTSAMLAAAKASEALASATSAQVTADTIVVPTAGGKPPPPVPPSVPPSATSTKVVTRAEVAGGIKALKMIMRGGLRSVGGSAASGTSRRSTLAKLLGKKQHRKTAARRSVSRPAKRRTAATPTPKRRKTRRV